MHTTIDGINVRAIASTVPHGVFRVDSLAHQFGTRNIERVIASSGIEELRHVEDGVTAADLCESAARKILDATQLDLHSITGLIFISQTPDYRLPATSAVLQHKLGLSQDIVVFDINHGCTGYVYGLYQAAMLIASGGCERVLVLAGDTISRLTNPRDRAVCVLMGDAGSATLVERGRKSITFEFHTDGSRYDSLIVPAGAARLPHCEETTVEVEEDGGNWRCLEDLKMVGLKITEFTLSNVVRTVKNTLAAHSLSVDDVGQYIFHQANSFVVGSMVRSLKIPTDKAPILVEKYGNTSSASIPLALSEKFGANGDNTHARSINDVLERAMLIGFGVGLTWGTTIADLSRTHILPVEDL